MLIYAQVRARYLLRTVLLVTSIIAIVAIPILPNSGRAAAGWRDIVATGLVIALAPLVAVAATKILSKVVHWATPLDGPKKLLFLTLALLPALVGMAAYVVNLRAWRVSGWLTNVMNVTPILWHLLFFCGWTALTIMTFMPHWGGFPLTPKHAFQTRRILAVALGTFFLVSLLMLFGPEAETVSKIWITLLGPDLHPPNGLDRLRNVFDRFMAIFLAFLPLLVTTASCLAVSWKLLPIEYILLRRERARKRRLIRDRCFKCGYTRSGLPHGSPCPECGEPSRVIT